MKFRLSLFSPKKGVKGKGHVQGLALLPLEFRDCRSEIRAEIRVSALRMQGWVKKHGVHGSGMSRSWI